MTRVGPVQIVSTRTFGKLCDRNECRFGPFSLVAISLQRDGANDVVEFGNNPAYPEYHWHGLQLIAGNLYILGGIGLFLVALVVAFRVARTHGGVTALLLHPRAPRP